MDVNPIFFFQTGSHMQACSFEAYRCSRGVMRIPGRLIRLAVGNETEYKRFSYIHGRCRACTHCASNEYRRLSRMRSSVILWKLQICNMMLSSTRQAPSIFFHWGWGLPEILTDKKFHQSSFYKPLIREKVMQKTVIIKCYM